MAQRVLKIILSVLAVGFLIAESALATQRFLINEHFTNTNCHAAYNSDVYMDSLREIYFEDFVTVRYHMPFPDPTDPFYNYIPDELSEKKAYYVIGFLPETSIDGTKGGVVYRTWAQKILQRLQVPSQLEISLSGYYQPDEHIGVLNIDITPTGPIPEGDLYLRAVAFADSVYYEDHYGLNWHNGTVFQFLPSPMGKKIGVVNGQTSSYTQTFTVADYADPAFVGFAVWIQNDSTKVVYQGARSYLRDFQQSNVDIDITPLEDSLRSIPPNGGYLEYQGFLKNYSSEPQDLIIQTVVRLEDSNLEINVGNYGIRLESLETMKFDHLSQWIPGFIPPGHHQLYAYIGDQRHPDYTWAVMEFTKDGEQKYSPQDEIPGQSELLNIYPNPFNSSATITYQLFSPSAVNLDIYNIRGQRIITLVDEYQSPGTKNIVWHGISEKGETVATGVYFCKLKMMNQTQIQKLILQK